METARPSILMDEVRNAFERIRDLPFSIYASDKDGTFLFANEQAMEFFGVDPNKPLKEYNIRSYYDDERERDAVLRQLQLTRR